MGIVNYDTQLNLIGGRALAGSLRGGRKSSSLANEKQTQKSPVRPIHDQIGGPILGAVLKVILKVIT